MARSRREPPPAQLADQIRSIVRQHIEDANQLEYVTNEMLDVAAEGVAQIVRHSSALIEQHPPGSGPDQIIMDNPTPNWEFVRAPILSPHNDAHLKRVPKVPDDFGAPGKDELEEIP